MLACAHNTSDKEKDHWEGKKRYLQHVQEEDDQSNNYIK